MEDADKSSISELKSFVAAIERDDDEVKEALRLPWSQGITKGKVNKLKTIKRQMYGQQSSISYFLSSSANTNESHTR